ncbi:MAG TPA: polysaccharide biosynthesis/export family protein, partial [Vicinamibacteria bacterium]
MDRLASILLWPFLFGLASGPVDGQARATKLVALKLLPQEAGFLAILQADGPMEHRIVEEQNPQDRLVLDVLGVSNPLRHYYPESHPFLERILMYEYPPATNPRGTGPLARIVFELKGSVGYQVEPKENELHVRFSENAAPAPPTAPAPVPVEPKEDNGHTAAPEDIVPEAPAEDVTDPLVPSKVAIEPPDVPVGLFFQASSATIDDYKLGPEDVVEVRVFELDQLNRTVRVSGDGKIELPLVGSIEVAGLTTNKVAGQIADRLRDRYVQNPQVSIFVTEFNSQKVSLLGAVANPATYPLSGQRRLLQVLAEAGSLGPSAGSTLYVFRQTEDGRSARLTVPLNELLLQGDPRWNILLRAGDVISVPPEQAIAVTVLGAVNEPGVHKLPVGDAATLLKAVALAGGLNERASKK